MIIVKYFIFAILILLNVNKVGADTISKENLQQQIAEVCGEKSCEFIFKKMKQFAKNGSPRAQATLSLMYAGGFGTEMNPKLSVKYIKKAAKSGFDYAEYKLGMMYRNGQFVDKNDEEADYWLKRVAKDGYKPAVDLLLSENKITLEEVNNYEEAISEPVYEEGVEVIVITAEKYSLTDLYELLKVMGFGKGHSTGSRIKGRGCGNSSSPCAMWKINSATGRSEFNTMISKLNAIQTAVQMSGGGG